MSLLNKKGSIFGSYVTGRIKCGEGKMLLILPCNEYKVRCIDVLPWEGNSRQKVGHKVSRQRFERVLPDFYIFGNDIVLCV